METLQDISLYKKINQLSNEKKFKIIKLTQKRTFNIGSLSKNIQLAFNKCSNYCTELEKEGLIEKQKEGKNTLIKSKVLFSKNSLIFN